MEKNQNLFKTINFVKKKLLWIHNGYSKDPALSDQ